MSSYNLEIHSSEGIVPIGAGRPAVLPSFDDYGAPTWEDGIRPELATCVLVIHEPADNTSASVAIQELSEAKPRRSVSHIKRLNPQAPILSKSQLAPPDSKNYPTIPAELEYEVDKLVKDYAHLRYFPPRQNELAMELEILIKGVSSGRVKAIAKRWNGGSGVRYPVRIGSWLAAFRQNIAQKVQRRVC